MSITCPRRMLDFGPWERQEGLDSVRGESCSFCGSLMPERFLERVRAGNELGPTDKPYKVYLKDPWGKFYFQHLSGEQRREFFDLYQSGAVRLGYPGYFYVLPFFIRAGPAK